MKSLPFCETAWKYISFQGKNDDVQLLCTTLQPASGPGIQKVLGESSRHVFQEVFLLPHCLDFHLIYQNIYSLPVIAFLLHSDRENLNKIFLEQKLQLSSVKTWKPLLSNNNNKYIYIYMVHGVRVRSCMCAQLILDLYFGVYKYKFDLNS